MVRAIESRLQRVEIDGERIERAEHDGVVAVALVVVAPDGTVGEDGEEGGDLALHDCAIALVKRYPLRDDAARVEVASADFKILLRVEHGSAFDPRMDRIGGDDVEFFGRRGEIVPGVVVDDFDAAIMEHVVVFLGETSGDGAWDQRLDLANHDALDRRVSDERSGGHAGAATHDEHRARLRMEEGGDMAEHELEPHVLEKAGRLGFSADVEETPAGTRFCDRDGSVDTLANKEDIGGGIVGVDLSAVSDELPGRGGQTGREHERDGRGRSKRDRAGKMARRKCDQRCDEREDEEDLRRVLSPDQRN